MDERNVVVLGGSGFIGRHVTALLSDHGMTVTAICRRPVTHLAGNIRFRRVDLETVSARELQGIFKDASSVINATGSIWGRSTETMESSIVRPTEVTLKALESMKSNRRYIHLGSVLEDFPEGNNEYGRAKATAAKMVLASVEFAGMDGCLLRIANVIGPGSPWNSLSGRVAAQLSENVSSDARVLRLGALDASRDLVDARDVAEAVVRAVLAPSARGVIPIGSGRSTPVRRLVQELIDVSGVPAQIECSKSVMGHSTGSIQGVDLTAARIHLGWAPTRTLTASMRDYWTEYKQKVEQR